MCKYLIVVEEMSAGFSAYSPDLDGCVATGSTREEVEQNMREAIPHLASVAQSETVDTTLRIRAWVDLARAHLWIGEAEKGRHQAEALIAEWGHRKPEGLAGGKLVLASHDARGKRIARARQNLFNKHLLRLWHLPATSSVPRWTMV